MADFSESKSIKFLVFADLHHEPGVFYADREDRLKQMMDRAHRENADFVVSLGDFLHNPPINGYLAGIYESDPLPTHYAIGNHDADKYDVAVTVDLFQMPNNYYSFDMKGYRFLILDDNFMTDAEGKPVAYGPRGKKSEGMVPEEQLAWMEKTITESPYPCILFSHESITRKDGIVNRDAIWDIIDRANAKRPGNVILSVNGHYHEDGCEVKHHVCVLDLNSSSYYWINDFTNPLFTREMHDKCALCEKTMDYTEPLSAVVTLGGTETVEVEGKKSGIVMPFDLTVIDKENELRAHPSSFVSPEIRDYKVNLKDETCVASAPKQ